MPLTDNQSKRYSRHIILDGVGTAGQEKLLHAKVLVVGAGGLGSAAIIYLAGAGVGVLGIVDDDTVDLSNLQRQIIHTTADLGREKVLSARETVNAINPDVRVELHKTVFCAENASDLVKAYDIVLDCTDNFPAKFCVNDACVLAKKPFVHAGVVAYKGQMMTYVPGDGPCYRCIFQNPPKDVPTSREIGILSPLPGVLGCLQAIEAVKYLTGAGTLLTGTLLTLDVRDMSFRRVPLPKRNPACPVCGDHPIITNFS